MSSLEQMDLIFTGIQTFIILGGFFAAIRQLYYLNKNSKQTIELTARQNAMRLIERYNEQAFVDRRVELMTNEEKQKNYYECAYVLNLFEEIAIAVKHRTANEILIEDFYGSVLRIWMEKDYMVKTIENALKEDPACLENLLDMYRNWEKKRKRTLKIDRIVELK